MREISLLYPQPPVGLLSAELPLEHRCCPGTTLPLGALPRFTPQAPAGNLLHWDALTPSLAHCTENLRRKKHIRRKATKNSCMASSLQEKQLPWQGSSRSRDTTGDGTGAFRGVEGDRHEDMPLPFVPPRLLFPAHPAREAFRPSKPFCFYFSNPVFCILNVTHPTDKTPSRKQGGGHQELPQGSEREQS